MKKNKAKFSGIWPAMFTPVTDTGEPAFDQLERLVDLLVGQGLDGLYILGSTGQGVLFTERQRMLVTDTVLRVVAKRVPVVVQVGAMTTAESIRLARHAAACGADGISSVGPIYFPVGTAGALEHYRQIAAATDLPFFPYQLGSDTMGDINSFIDRLLEIPHVHGMKLTTGKLMEISLIHLRAGEQLHLFSGADELMCHASLCGASGAIGTCYNLWGSICREVYNEFKAGNFLLGKAFMLEFQKIILQILPNIWTFLRKAMLIKYHVDIGRVIAPLGTMQQEWQDEEVIAICNRIESIKKTHPYD